MKKFLTILLLFTVTFGALAQQRPKLVVGIVVDQMRWDYLYRYADKWGNEGLNRLKREGFNYENTHFNYVPTVTAAGHCSIYAGSTPAITGIAGNSFYINGHKVYCCEDTTVRSVGSKSEAGMMSPRNSQVTSMCDQLRLATDFESKTIGIALKDRAAILPAGHSANAAYWYDKDEKQFITSTYYMKDLPEWVKQFNKAHQAAKPKDLHYSPEGLKVTTQMAIAALEGERLGLGKATDFLAVSYSSTDYVGHKYGTRGKNVDEIYLALDKEISLLLNRLDQHVGKGNYLLFLTADHAAAHNAKFLNDNRIPAGWIGSSEMQDVIDDYLQEKFGKEDLVIDVLENRVYLNHEAIRSHNLSLRKVKAAVCEALMKDHRVYQAVRFDKVESAPIAPQIKQRIIMGYHPKRSGDIQIIMLPGYNGAPYDMGTTHVAWNPYDTHVPFILYGWNIKHGSSNQYVSISDIAATICALLKIQMPTGCVGQPVL